ncbi:MAG: Omp28-related outer membrane protein, partial [Flavobacteriales bacterium]|nr:Omp28-related outer membrane protein [Flavobacteriales bacterium]
MNKLVLPLMFVALQSFGQTFLDDFESYSSGAYVAASSADWVTWSGQFSQDVQIVSSNAHSGNNSIYLSSTSSTGGPQDIVLPFNGEYTTGGFNFKSWFNVETGKGAYFNFQAESVIGNVWSVECQMDETGKMIFRGDGNQLLETTFTHGTWFELEVDVNLNTNMWEVLIDGSSIGIFQNHVYQVASLNLYPVNASNSQAGYWMDDIEYTVTPFVAPTLNAAISRINYDGALSGQSIEPVLEIRNLGSTVITSVDVSLDYVGQQLTESVSGLNIPVNGTYDLPLNGTMQLISGTNLMTAVVSNVNGNGNDDYGNDDTKLLHVTPIDPANGKIVVAEEATGTWCQWCPRGAVYMERFTRKYGKFFAGVAVHNGDPMADAIYDTGLNGLISGYPSAVVDRGSDIDPSAMEPDFLTRIMIEPAASLTNVATYDPATKELKVTVKTDYQQTGSGAYKIACVLTEDSVTGTSSGYAQSNAYAGGASGAMGGYENLPSPVPASMMVYDHVARVIAPSFDGTQGNLLSSFSPGDTVSNTFSFTLNNDWDADKIHIIAMLIAPNGRIETGSNSTIQEAIDNGTLSDGDDLIYGTTLQGPDN